MMNGRSLVAVGVVLALVLTFGWVAVYWNQHQVATVPPNAPAAAPVDLPLRQGSESAIREQIGVQASTPSHLVVQCMGGGGPIDKVRVSVVPVGSRWEKLDQLKSVGVTDNEGVMLVSHEVASASASRLVFHCPGFCVATLDLPSHETRVVVRMSQCSSTVVQCNSMDGRPIAGVVVAMSRKPMPVSLGVLSGVEDDMSEGGNMAVSAWLPTASPDLAVHVARSGLDGVATLPFVEPGSYLTCIMSGDYVVARGTFRRSVEVGEKRNFFLHLGHIMVAGCAVQGDKVLGHRVGYPKGLVAQEQLGSGKVARLRSDLEKKWTDAILDVVVAGSEQPFSCDVEILLARRGTRRWSLDYEPWKKGKDVQLREWDLTGDVGGTEPVPFTIRARDPEGHEVVGFPLVLQTSGSRTTSISVAIRSGVPVHVPPAEYSLFSTDRVFASALAALPPTLDVRGEQTVQVQVPESLRLCHLTIQVPEGLPVGSVGVAIQNNRGFRMLMECGQLEDVPLWLPCGPVRIGVDSRNHGGAEMDFEITRGKDIEPMALRMKLEAR